MGQDNNTQAGYTFSVYGVLVLHGFRSTRSPGALVLCTREAYTQGEANSVVATYV